MIVTDTVPAGGLNESIKQMPMSMTHSGILQGLKSVREPIVDYQETRGVSRTE